MKKLVYLLIAVFGVIAASCTEESVRPQGGDDDHIPIPPPPIPKP